MTFDQILNYLRLGPDAEEPQSAMAAIEKGVVFRGTNLLILVFAILIASVGLNVNSTAVVIGAMLISPLMGPIVGVGAGLGVLDLFLVRRALKNLGFAVGASLVTSTLYFLISPLGDAYSEILARTTPTIWDVLIATAGGFAGIIATASKENTRGNVVPGVAIATALMPPLCTAGFGLAHLNWSFFFGALYLFLINSVFIAIAALFTIRWLGYPATVMADERMALRIRRYTALIVLVTVVPSIYMAYRLVKQNAFHNNASTFVARETAVADNFLVEHKIDAPSRTIHLVYMGNGISPEKEADLHEHLDLYGIPDAKLEIRTGLSLSELGKKERTENEGLKRQVDESRAVLARLAALNDSLTADRNRNELIMKEARAMHPGLHWLVITDLPQEALGSDTLDKVVAAHFTTYPDTTEIARMERWLEVKLDGDRHTLAITCEEPAAEPDKGKRR
ncbi:MAG: DUF389 domain-containing protein [Flavobacteriales bacterium]|nr:DUF389 domain-containing protein [Flavobacteriales bacterium]